MTDSRTARKAELTAEVAQLQDKIRKHSTKANDAAARIAEARKELKRLELAPEPPTTAEVVRFVKKFGAAREYHYAAISHRLHGSPSCTHRRWSVTGKAALTSVPWARVAEFIAEKETAAVKVQWLQNSMVQPFAELGFNVEARRVRADEAAAFAVRESGKPYVFGGGY